MTDIDNNSPAKADSSASEMPASRELVEALEFVLDRVACGIDQYERNGPTYTSPGGMEMFEAPDVIEQYREFEERIRTALANTPDGWRDIDEKAKKLKRVDLCGYYPSTKHGPKLKRIPDCYWHEPSGRWHAAHRDRDGYSLLRSNFVITHYREIGPLPQPPETK